MNEGPRKYSIEGALLLRTRGSVHFRPGVIPYLGTAAPTTLEVLSVASIYFICTRPRIRITPDSFERSGNDLNFELTLETSSGRCDTSSGIAGFFSELPDVNIVQIHPELRFYTQYLGVDGSELGMIPVDAFVRPDSFEGFDPRVFDVTYIGQSNPEKTTGNIVSRLENHSTLQKIMSDCLANTPHLEVFILCFELDEPRCHLSFDPYATTDIPEEQDLAHASYLAEYRLSDSQLTSIAAACFIRYFQPKYNRLLVNSFPSTNLGLLRSCYEMDYAAVVSEVNTEDVYSMLRTTSVPARDHHIAHFDLHSPDDRMSFFQVSLDHDGNRSERWEGQPI